MKDDDAARLIMAPIGLIGIYTVIKMNGAIHKFPFPIPQIDRGLMFLWWLAPFVLGVLVVAGVVWLSYRFHRNHVQEKSEAIARSREEFRADIIKEVGQSFRYYEAELEKTEKSLKKRIYELESRNKSLSANGNDQSEVYQDFIIEKFI